MSGLHRFEGEAAGMSAGCTGGSHGLWRAGLEPGTGGYFTYSHDSDLL